MRRAYAHQAALDMDAAADTRAPGAAVTVALCGHRRHEPPCPLAAHHSRAWWQGGTVRLRVLFAAEPDREAEVRTRIDRALGAGGLDGPDGHVAWRLRDSGPSPVAPDEAAHADRLVGADHRGGAGRGGRAPRPRPPSVPG